MSPTDSAERSTPRVAARQERWSMYQLKRHALPNLCWHAMLRGRA